MRFDREPEHEDFGFDTGPHPNHDSSNDIGRCPICGEQLSNDAPPSEESHPVFVLPFDSGDVRMHRDEALLAAIEDSRKDMLEKASGLRSAGWTCYLSPFGLTVEPPQGE